LVLANQEAGNVTGQTAGGAAAARLIETAPRRGIPALTL